MYLVLILIPFINFILLGFFGRFLGQRGVIKITIFFFLIAFLALLLISYEVLFLHTICEIKLWKWIVINEIFLQFGFLFDPLSTIMCFVVFVVSTLVHIYSFDYMKDDPHFIRFIAFLSLFTFFMVLIITSNNFIQLFFGWECVGLASYLLINFWYTRIQANKSALKAIIVNKIGDLAILGAIVAIFWLTKSFDFITVFNYLTYTNQNVFEYNIFLNEYINIKINALILINIFLLLGAVAKSAQIGLHTWLADAMEGPTPVSALLHAATMVTVGVFCLIRCNCLFILTPNVLFYIIIIGALTALFGGVVGLYQNDIKRIIAYSTCSQLGYMFCACGLTYNELALYHLTNHAFFKALLFLTAGAVIHVYKGWQDIRMMGSSLNIYNELYIYFALGSLALMGLPFFSGFFSKDLIIEFSFINEFCNNSNLFIYTLLISAAFFTSYYSVRILYLTFIRKNIQSARLAKKIINITIYNKWQTIFKDIINNLNLIKQNWAGFLQIKLKDNKRNINYRHNIDKYTLIPLTILTFFTILSGWFLKDFFIGFGSDAFEGAFLIKHYINFNNLYFSVEVLPLYIKLLPNILTFVIIFLLFNIIYKESTLQFFNNTKTVNIFTKNNTWFNTYNNKFIIFFLKNPIYYFNQTFNFENDFYFEKKLFFDVLYYKIFIKWTFFFAYNILYKIIDRGFFEILGPTGLTNKIFITSFNIEQIHKNSFYHFIMYFIQNIIILLFVISNIYFFYNLDILILLCLIIFIIKLNIKINK